MANGGRAVLSDDGHGFGNTHGFGTGTGRLDDDRASAGNRIDAFGQCVERSQVSPGLLRTSVSKIDVNRSGRSHQRVDEIDTVRRPEPRAIVITGTGIEEIVTVRIYVIADCDVVEATGVRRPLRNPVKRRIDKADRREPFRGRLLIDQGRECSPKRRSRAGSRSLHGR